MAGATTQAERQSQVLAAGYNGPLTDAAINQAYANAATPSDLAQSGISNKPQTSSTSSSTNPGTTSTVNNEQQNLEYFNQQAEALKNQAAATAAQIAYQYAHMQQVELPGLQIQKDQLSFQKAQEAALEAYRQADLNLRTIAEQHQNEIATGQLDLAKLTQAQNNQLAIANLGLDTLKLVASLQADPFRQQAVINGLAAGGYSNAIEMVTGAQGAGVHAIVGSAADSATLASLAARITTAQAAAAAGDITHAPGSTGGTGSTGSTGTTGSAGFTLGAPGQYNGGGNAPGSDAVKNGDYYYVGSDGNIYAQNAGGAQNMSPDANTTLKAPSFLPNGTKASTLAELMNATQTAPAAPAAPAPSTSSSTGTSSDVLFNPPSGADGASATSTTGPAGTPAGTTGTSDQAQSNAALDALPNDPHNGIVARNFLQLDPTSQQYVLSGLSAKNGLSMDTNAALIKQSLPGFEAPRGTVGTA